MKIARALLPLLFVALPCAAQEDPLKSAACGTALARLQAAREQKADAGSVERLRAAAAGTCLGSANPPVRPGRVLQAPVAVPPPQIEVPVQVAPVPVPVPAAPAPPVAIQRPPVPALCDAGGCWTNDGSHLQQLPPGLIGPRGLCTQQGGLVYCP
jgi:hypothetical protein